MKHNFKDIFALYQKISAEKAEVRYPYYYLQPVIFTSVRMNNFRKLQTILVKAINYYVKNFEAFDHITGHNDKVYKIAEIGKKYQYRIGVYRPDFVVGPDGQISIVEINARYFHGYFLHGLTEFIMENKLGCYSYIDGRKPIDLLIDQVFNYFGNFNRLIYLRGNDRDADNRYFQQLFEKSGIEFLNISPKDLSSSHNLLNGSAIINGFNQMELDNLTPDEIELLSASNLLNNLRTIFLVHDKRFLAVLFEKNFQAEVFSKEEIEFIRPYLTPTFTRKQDKEVWEIARLNRKDWILKPNLLGQSDGIVPGLLVSDEKWESIFKSSDIEQMILQPMLPQRTFTGKISRDGKEFTDYATGTLLYFDDKFFGPGEFRATSTEVVNFIKDDRKIGPWITDDYQDYKDGYFLL
ncbi:MAG: hypothetical protein K9I71_03265 [Ignavibacteriales bacterium]|nr:hypothetical protein [Ignavibacteriales bacterium]MCF8435891.1 hypothetical protein [Ignavibacteriales bacterium]